MGMSDLKTALEAIRRTSLKILRQESVSTREWNGLILTVHSVNASQGENEIYSQLQKDVSSAIELSKQKMANRSDRQTLLKIYTDEWTKFSAACANLADAIRPTKRLASKYDSNRDKLRNFMLNAWNEAIFSEIKPSIRQAVAELIEGERNGEMCDAQLIIKARKSYVELVQPPEETDWNPELMFGEGGYDVSHCTIAHDKLGLYREFFEKDYIENTRTFYRIRAPAYLTAHGVEKYTKYAHSKIREEVARGEKYLEPDVASQRALTSIWGDLFVAPYKETILAEFPAMVKRNDVENLRITYGLMALVDGGFPPMLRVLEDHVLDVEEAAIDVQRLLDQFGRFNELVRAAFKNDPRFLLPRDKAFKKIINDKKMAAESLANFCDMLLRRTQMRKKLTDVGGKLKDVVSLLKYVNNRDVFMACYKSHLTRRLILETSADTEMEEEMVGRLRDIGMPVDYVCKFAQMFRDVKVSGDLNALFKLHTRKDSMNIKVFNASAWAGLNDGISVSLPVELEEYYSGVEEFYGKQHSGRKLVWRHRLSNGTITFSNSAGKFDLEVTGFQAAVLFAWNERSEERVSLEDLRLATGLPDSELRKTMWSLVSVAMVKRGVVLCHPEVKSLSEFKSDSLFWINEGFCLVRNGRVEKRGKVNLIGRLQLSMDGGEVDNGAITRVRELRVQEAVVCVAKARKSVQMSHLQMELVSLLKNMFVPSKKMIKQQVEWLIEKNFLCRDEHDLNVVVYIA